MVRAPFAAQVWDQGSTSTRRMFDTEIAAISGRKVHAKRMPLPRCLRDDPHGWQCGAAAAAMEAFSRSLTRASAADQAFGVGVALQIQGSDVVLASSAAA